MALNMFGMLIDAYDRPAHLYPALLCIVPIVGVAAGVYGPSLTLSSALMCIALALGLLIWFTSISRNMGKRLEKPLYEKWGGKPGVLLLRHRFESSALIDYPSRKRYHDFLGERLGTSFPTEQLERDHPRKADDIYEGGILYLVERTRNRAKYPQLFEKLVQYGAARNMLGLKPVGMLAAMVSIVWAMLFIGLDSGSGFSFGKLIAAPLGVKLSLITSVTIFLSWLLVVTRERVQKAAFGYAAVLLGVCDDLHKKA